MSDPARQEFFVESRPGIRLLVMAQIPEKRRLKRALLLVHGSGVGWPYWDIPIRDYSIMGYLADRGLDVYAIECRGYGRSSKPSGMEVTATSMAEDIQSVVSFILKKSGVGKVSVAGHSSGGTALMVAAGRFPELLDRMILIGTPYKKINPLFQEYASKVIQTAREPGKDYVANLHYQDIECRLDKHEEDVVVWYKRLVKEQYSLMPGGLLPDIIKNPGIPIVPTMNIPTLIFNGSNEYVIELDDALDLFRDLGTADKSMIIQPGGFHLPFLEKKGHLGLQESIFFWVTKS